MTVVRCKKTISMPSGATIKKNTVTWLDKRGNRKNGTLTPNGRVLVECNTFQIEYRDENGKRRRESTNLKSAESAQYFLSQRIKEVQRIKAGIITRQDLREAETRRLPLSDLVGRYINHVCSAGRTKRSVSSACQKLNEVIAAVNAKTAADITPEKVEAWIVLQRQEGKRAAGTINSYIGRLNYFCRWAVKNEYLAKNPIADISKLNEEVDRRKKRRSLLPEELVRLFETARHPVRHRPDDVELIYRLLAGTGLRSKELSLAIPSQFNFKQGSFRVEASQTKNKRADVLPIRQDLLCRLKEYIAQRNIAPSERIFKYQPYMLLRWFKSDLKAAGIERVSPDGRSLDVHCLRRTFGTLLARAGVPLTTTQRLMRHSNPELTAKIYIDVEPTDMVKALEKLPAL
jgi:integrase